MKKKNLGDRPVLGGWEGLTRVGIIVPSLDLVKFFRCPSVPLLQTLGLRVGYEGGIIKNVNIPPSLTAYDPLL